jgi:tRNA pseudouridine55 synthase
VTTPVAGSASGRVRPARRRVDGVVLLDKPEGLTSNQALQRVRQALAAAKAGHAGTLDPMATGMLPLCFGQATKTCGIVLGSRKAYRARLHLGTATDTGDAQGAVVGRAEVPALDAGIVMSLLREFEGASDQIPPMVSALKHQGERLYHLARRGESVPRAGRRIELYRVELVALAGRDIEFDVECSKGTYVRVLAEDVAARLGTVGHLAALRRLWVAPFESEPMVTLEEISAWRDAAGAAHGSPAWLRPVDCALAGLARVDLGPTHSASIRHGRTIPSEGNFPTGTTVCAYDPDGALLGLLEVAPDRRLRVVRLLADTQTELPGPT